MSYEPEKHYEGTLVPVDWGDDFAVSHHIRKCCMNCTHIRDTYGTWSWCERSGKDKDIESRTCRFYKEAK